MTLIKRFGFFILTNILVVLTISLLVGFISQFFGIRLNGGGYAGLMIICLIWGMAGSFISLQLSRWMAKKFHGVQVIDPNTTKPSERKLIDTVYQIARRAGMDTMPEVGYYESPDVNAFATGPSKSRSLVAVSTGLLNTMNSSELEGVLAHEIAHIVNGDMVTLALLQGIVNAFAMFIAHIVTTAILNAIRKNDDNERSGFGDFMLRQFIYNMVSMIFTLLGSIVVCYFSRRREFRADAGGSKYSSSDKMGAALIKLQSLHSIPNLSEEKGNDSLAAMKISGKKSGFLSLFSTHPPIEDRIAAIKNKTFADAY